MSALKKKSQIHVLCSPILMTYYIKVQKIFIENLEFVQVVQWRSG